MPTSTNIQVDSSLRTIPQLHQLEIMFKGPLWTDMQVATAADLQTVGRLFANKLVWVNDENTWYYYVGEVTSVSDDGETIRTQRWEKQDRSNITVYDQTRHYMDGECVFLNGKIYLALTEIQPGETPLEEYDPAKWMCISGETITKTHVFSNVSAVVIETDIENPIFEVFIEDAETGADEKVFPSYEKLSDSEYRFEFYENGELSPKTGYIIHK